VSFDEAKQAVRLVGDAGGEKQLVAASVIRRAATELQSPQAINGQRIPFRVDELRVEIATGHIEGVDPPVAKIAYEQMDYPTTCEGY